jgi:putative aldouronate transport system permease protein
MNLIGDNKFTRSKGFRRFYKERGLWLISSLGLIWLILFAYAPMYGIIYSFFDYIPGWKLFETRFVGLKNFIDFFRLPEWTTVLRNTLVMGLIQMTFGFVMPIILALLFNEIYATKFKRVVQTISYLPHFISWVVMASITFTILGSEGVLNDMLQALGINDTYVNFLGTGRYYWVMITLVRLWKSIGWGTILYMSAIAGIDPELYQAGAVDGLGRFGMIRHISLPSIAPTILLLFILGAGSILNAGFEEHLLLGQPTTREYYDVIDTYVYRFGIQLGRYSFATAVGFMKAVIGIILVFGTNAMSKKISGISII